MRARARRLLLRGHGRLHGRRGCRRTGGAEARPLAALCGPGAAGSLRLGSGEKEEGAGRPARAGRRVRSRAARPTDRPALPSLPPSGTRRCWGEGTRVRAGPLSTPSPDLPDVYTLGIPSAPSAGAKPSHRCLWRARFGEPSPMCRPSQSLQAVTGGAGRSRAGAAGGRPHWLPSPGRGAPAKCRGLGIRVREITRPSQLGMGVLPGLPNNQETEQRRRLLKAIKVTGNVKYGVIIDLLPGSVELFLNLYFSVLHSEVSSSKKANPNISRSFKSF